VQNEAIGVILCVLVILIPIALLIGALILRGGVYFANKCIPKESEPDYDDRDDRDEEDRPRPRRRRGAAIPMPGIGWAMLIVFLNGIVSTIITTPIDLALGLKPFDFEAEDDPAIVLLSMAIELPIGFLLAAGFRTLMLPTSFGRACLVVLFEYLIGIVIGLVLAVPLIVVMVLLFAAAG
jgi:hypothetical protein